MKCCTEPGCHVKTRRDFEVEYYQQSLQWDKDGRRAPQPVLQFPLGLMAHTATDASETHRVSTLGASLRTRILDNHTIVIGRNSSTEMIGLVLNLDEKYRKTAAQKAHEIATGNKA